MVVFKGIKSSTGYERCELLKLNECKSRGAQL